MTMLLSLDTRTEKQAPCWEMQCAILKPPPPLRATTEFVSQSRMLYVRSCGRGRGILEDAVRIGESLLSQLVFFS